ncbi:MAG: hypothetical protein GQ529_06255 [Methyloprofundus sp.]|nr:hypothetical protein [Methyloprofundus sp.]
MPNYTIHCADFDQAQQLSIAAILDLADSALNDSWNITESTESDIVMINVQGEKGPKLVSEYDSLAEYRIILVAENSQESFQNYWFLEKKEHAPPSLRMLVDLFNQVGTCLVEAAASASEGLENYEESTELVNNALGDTSDLPEQVAEVALLDTQEQGELEDKLPDTQEQSELEGELLDTQEQGELEDELLETQEQGELEDGLLDTQENSGLEDEPIEGEGALVVAEPDIKHEDIEKPQRKLSVDNYLFGLLLQANKEKKYRIIKLNKLPVLYLAPEEGCYYFSGTEEELLQYCLVVPGRLNVKILSRAKFNKALKSESSELQQKDFRSLICYAIIHVSQGQLLDEHSAKQILVLRSLPDVEGNSILSRYKAIAEHMYQQEGSLFDVAETLQVSLADVFDFYNVCYLLGYIKMIATGGKGLEAENTQTLGRFLKSFFTK